MRFANLANSEAARLVRRQKAGSLPVLAPAGTLRFGEVLGQASWSAFLFVFVLLMHVQSLRFHHQTSTVVLTWVGIILVWVMPIVTFVIYLVGVWRTISTSVARCSACVFWLYWPFWRVVSVIVAVGLACNLGDNLWYNNFQLYEEYYRLQAYDNLDIRTVTGSRLQDAGLVRFNTSAEVDRSRAACIINGKTFCVAPIVHSGVVKAGVQDLYMAGVDCCNCPVTDFRCGDWDGQTGKLGGMRLFDKENNRMFQLAAEKISAGNDKAIIHGVFFAWANEPIAAWKRLWGDGFHHLMLYCIFGILGSFLAMVILNGFMRVLCYYQLAAPIDERPLQFPWIQGTDSHKKDFIPNDYYNYLHQKEPRAWEQETPKFAVL